MSDVQPLSLGERLKRLREHRGFQKQTQLAEVSGVKQGTISSIENDNQNTIQEDKIALLSVALKVPEVFWRTFNPREFAGAWLATWTPEEKSNFRALKLHKRVEYILNEMATLWGDNFSVEGVAGFARMDAVSVAAMLEGDANISDDLVHAVCELTGLPFEIFKTPTPPEPLSVQSTIPPGYIELAEELWAQGVIPDRVRELIRLADALRDEGRCT